MAEQGGGGTISMEAFQSNQAEAQANEQAIARQDQADATQGTMPEGYDANGDPIVAEGGGQASTPTEKIGGKFDTQEDLLKAYQELEKKQSGTPTTPEVPTKTEDPVEKPKEGDTPSELSTESFTDYVNEYNKDGSISEDSYTALAKQGLSKSVVDNYIAGQVAITAQAVSNAQSVVGGEEQYNELIGWAVDNLSDTQKADFNSKVMSGNADEAKEAIEYLQYKRGGAQPQEARRVNGQAIDNSSGVKIFNDVGELRVAHANPLYGSDRVYTEAIDARYLKSLEKGTIR